MALHALDELPSSLLVHVPVELWSPQDTLALAEQQWEAQDAYARKDHEMVKDTVWAVGGCSSWYLDAGDEPSAVWPSSAWHYRKCTRRFDVEACRVTRRATVPARRQQQRRQEGDGGEADRPPEGAGEGRREAGAARRRGGCRPLQDQLSRDMCPG